MHDPQDMIDAIVNWAEEQEDFDTAFVESLAEQLAAKGSLSEKQVDALQTIIEQWRIDVREWT